jgi:O-antigen/teichoic acid export membrane protein
MLAEVGHVAHALLALYVLTNLDVLLARHYLSAYEAGLFAAGAIVAKVAFWLPHFVTVVALPRLADRSRRGPALRVAATATIIVGMAAAVVTAAAGSAVVLIVSGPAYAPLSSFVWLFALEGSLFAMAQLYLYGRLSRQDRGAVLAVWAAVLLLTLGVVTVGHSSATSIVVWAIIAAAGLALSGTAWMLRQRSVACEVGRGVESAG